MSEEPEQRRPRAPMGGQLVWWPFVVALVAVAVVVILIVVVGGGSTGSRQQGTGLTSSGAVACPEFYEHADTVWVPAKPAGVHSKKKMVPKLHPTHVTVCRYRVSTNRNRSVRLAGQRELGGKLDRVVDTLRAVPAAPKGDLTCNSPATFSGRDYLIALRYDEAIVWVSATGLTCGSGNGSFVSDRNLHSIAAASYAARTWVSSAH